MRGREEEERKEVRKEVRKKGEGRKERKGERESVCVCEREKAITVHTHIHTQMSHILPSSHMSKKTCHHAHAAHTSRV